MMQTLNSLRTRAQTKALQFSVFLLMTLWTSLAFAGKAGGGGRIGQVAQQGLGGLFDDVKGFLTGPLAKWVGGIMAAGAVLGLFFSEDKKGGMAKVLWVLACVGMLVVIIDIVDGIFGAAGALV